MLHCFISKAQCSVCPSPKVSRGALEVDQLPGQLGHIFINTAQRLDRIIRRLQSFLAHCHEEVAILSDETE